MKEVIAMIKLCIFDLDGTVADTLKSIAYFANNALKKYGFEPFSEDDYRYFVGDGADLLIRRITEKSGGNDDDYKKIKAEYMKTYNADCTHLLKTYDGITELLQNLKKLKINRVILSNKPQIQAESVAKSLFKDGLIDECFGGREGIPLKPNPKITNEIIEKYGFQKNECLFIGDTKTDIMTAKNCGIKSVGVLWGFRDKAELSAHGADFIAHTPSDILSFIKTL